MAFHSSLIITKACKNGILVKTGIFSYVRHPIYAGNGIIGTFGLILLFNRLAGFFAILINYFVLAVYLIPKEEKILVEEFGDEFIQYKEKVGGYFPKLI